MTDVDIQGVRQLALAKAHIPGRSLGHCTDCDVVLLSAELLRIRLARRLDNAAYERLCNSMEDLLKRAEALELEIAEMRKRVDG